MNPQTTTTKAKTQKTKTKKKEKIAVIGLGKAGLPLAAVIADSGFTVTGIDIDAERCRRINKGENPLGEEPGLDELIQKHGGKNLTASTDYRDASQCTLFTVIVPLFLDKDNTPDFSALSTAFKGVAQVLKRDDTVVLETTVSPTTTETLVRNWLEEGSRLKLGDFNLAFSPERIMTGFSISRLREFPKIIGGVDEKSGEQAYQLYRQFIPNLKKVSSARAAEFIKVIEGCYRDVNVALANELFQIADSLNIDFYEAREAANHKYCDIHLPSTGVGGHCIPVYPWFLIKEMERKEKYDSTKLLRTARETNDEMINFWAGKITQKCLELNKPLAKIKICINGLTYRKGVKETYHSRNLALTQHLTKKGLNTYAYDELLTPKEIEKFGLKPLQPSKADIIFDSFNLTINTQTPRK
ncbi:MAG: nucleotide sugar dehydrogenase [Thaumarchaeota archaeon]|nr:nucleotide sugar dehydrogenase [Nitrososphaerota archaeon]MCL5318624.1 nucleotide sugar dehydrogenase [Nitrososphaerota archaeon]